MADIILGAEAAIERFSDNHNAHRQHHRSENGQHHDLARLRRGFLIWRDGPSNDARRCPFKCQQLGRAVKFLEQLLVKLAFGVGFTLQIEQLNTPLNVVTVIAAHVLNHRLDGTELARQGIPARGQPVAHLPVFIQNQRAHLLLLLPKPDNDG